MLLLFEMQFHIPCEADRCKLFRVTENMPCVVQEGMGGGGGGMWSSEVGRRPYS